MNHEIMDHQDILRSLSKTILIKILVKKTVSQLEKERRRQEEDIQNELNLQVRKWGLDVQKVELSEPKVLKQPESGSNNATAVGSILKGFPGINPPQEGSAISPEECGWGRCLEVILQSEFNGPMDEEACGLYKLEITDTEIEKDIYFISLSQDSKSITSGNETNGVSPDGCQPVSQKLKKNFANQYFSL